MSNAHRHLPDRIRADPPLWLASLSGESNVEWAKQGSTYAGGAILGGIALDSPTREAAREMADRDRDEFLPSDPLAWIDEQLAALSDCDLVAGVNVRAASPEPVAAAAARCADHGAICEINAHCRQAEMCATGAGQSLLEDVDRLCDHVRAGAEAGAVVSLKCRTEVPGVDLSAVAAQAADAGASIIHVDAMDSEARVADVAAATDAYVIANNEVRDRASVAEYLEYGADAVSVGRPSDDQAVLSRVAEALKAL